MAALGRLPSIALMSLLILSVPWTPVEGQESTFIDIVEVELIEVEALITDADGRPVLDLSAGDFQLFDSGEPVEITHFARPRSAHEAATDPAISNSDVKALPSAGTLPRLVIFLDELHLNLRSRHLTFSRLQEVITSELPATTEVMLVSYAGAVDVLAPFTSNRKEIVRLLAERLSGAAQATSDRVQEETLMRQLPRSIEIMGVPPDFLESACSSASGAVRGHASQVLGGVQAVVGALGQFVRSLAAYPGPKSLLYVSDGLPLVAGQQVYDYLIELCDGSLTSSSADPALRALANLAPATRFASRARLEMLEFSTQDLWSELAAEANTRRVTLNTVQASGLEPSRRASVDGAATSSMTQNFSQRNRQEPLVIMAKETGGAAILNTNDVMPAVVDLIQAESSRYVLAFASRHPADGQTHDLRLEVSRPDTRTAYRRSYKSRSPDERVADGVLASLHHGFEDNTHRVRVAASSLEGRRMALEIEVPLRSLVLLPEGDGTRGLFTVFIGALDSAGIGTGIREKTVAIRSGPNETRKNHVVQTVLELETSRDYVVAVAVRDELGASTSFVTTRFRAK